MISQTINQLCLNLEKEFDFIPEERKALLSKLAIYIQGQKDKKQTIRLVYVCTHNSRRSHFGQIWANVAANYFGINDVETFSAGTESTAFNPNAIAALKVQGFIISKEDETSNPRYTVNFGTTEHAICFSKTIDDDSIPTSEFAAIMTCSDAEENCPFIPGVDLRIGTTYNDPKAFDGTPLQDEKYQERSLEIAKECLYTFSLIK
ncbi:MAG: protein-tyrosine-phosphatase [Fluviicola sp.]